MNSFVRESLEKAQDVIQQGHVSFEIKQVLKDLIVVIEQMEALKNENTGMSADKRYKEAKLNEERAEKRRIEKNLEKMKQVLTQELPPLIKEMSQESQSLAQAGQALGNAAVTQSAERLKASLRGLVEAIAAAVKS